MSVKFACCDGVKILNLSHLPLDEDAFYKILKSAMKKAPFTSGDKREPLVWIQANDHNRWIFERLVPILSQFSTNQKRIFVKSGAILFRGTGSKCMEALICKRTDLGSKRSMFLDISE